MDDEADDDDDEAVPGQVGHQSSSEVPESSGEHRGKLGKEAEMFLKGLSTQLLMVERNGALDLPPRESMGEGLGSGHTHTALTHTALQP